MECCPESGQAGFYPVLLPYHLLKTTSWLVGWLVGEIADYSLSYSFNLEQVAVRHSGKSSMVTRERRGSCCVDRVISGYVR